LVRQELHDHGTESEMRRMAAERLVRKEDGFTLPEVLVTMTMMIVVLFALYSIFDMSIKVFSFGNDKVEAVENARLGMQKMERELRAAYPYNKPAGVSGNYRFWDPSNPTTSISPAKCGQQITFGNDLNGNNVIDPATEQITYQLSSTGPPYRLQRIVGTGAPQALVELVGEFPTVPSGCSNTRGLRFTPLTSSGGDPTTPADIARIRIELLINKKSGNDDRIQTLTTDVALRNPGS
jgi:type II secretory pathway pseudopilin PulG